MPATRTPALVPSKEAFTPQRFVQLNPARPLVQHPQSSHLDMHQGDGRILTAFLLTTDLNSAGEAADSAAAHGLTLQTLFPKEGLPREASALFVALDELLLDAHGRQEYLDDLRKLELPYPVVVISYDFQLDPPTFERPGFLRAARLEGDVLAALGHRRLAAGDHRVNGAAA